jgi:hypothetical protein
MAPFCDHDPPPHLGIALRPPLMSVRGCKPLRHVAVVATASSSSRLCESHNSGLQKALQIAHGAHYARGEETSPGWRVGDPALVLPTVPVLAQMAAAPRRSANRREPRAGR